MNRLNDWSATADAILNAAAAAAAGDDDEYY